MAEVNLSYSSMTFTTSRKIVQTEIGKQIKAAAETGVRICTASVPHRKDDVVRSNPELRGRVTGIDSDYWNENELAQIALTRDLRN